MNILVYTHSDYSFVWKLWFGQTDKYFPSLKKIILLDKDAGGIPENYTKIYYDPSLSYRGRVISCLKQLDPDDTVIFHHEDMFLYDTPELETLLEFREIVDANKNCLIKLIRAGNSLIASNIHPKLYRNPGNLRFAIQPTMIKVSKLLDIFSSTYGNSIWEFEQNSFTNPIIRESFFCFDNTDTLRGQCHYNSKVYPYIATAVVKGKWNMQEYGQELGKLFKEYSIG